jgi:predicted O-methyltransferase YrrM
MIWNDCKRFKIQQKKKEWISFLEILNKKSEKVDNILEIGCYDGGTTISLCRFCKNLITIDCINPARFDINQINQYCNYKYLSRNSQIIETKNEIYNLMPSIDVLFIDGDHSYEGAKKDYELFSPLVKSGGLIVFHDIVDELMFENRKFVLTLWKELQLKYKTELFYSDYDNNLFSIDQYDKSYKGGEISWGGIGVCYV